MIHAGLVAGATVRQDSLDRTAASTSTSVPPILVESEPRAWTASPPTPASARPVALGLAANKVRETVTWVFWLIVDQSNVELTKAEAEGRSQAVSLAN